MGDIIKFDSGRKAEQTSSRRKGRQGPRAPNGQVLPPPVNKETYQLWELSRDFDSLVTNAIVAGGIPPEEVAAVLAHRLGTLIGVTEQRDELLTFCTNLIKRLNLPDDSNDEAG